MSAPGHAAQLDYVRLMTLPASLAKHLQRLELRFVAHFGALWYPIAKIDRRHSEAPTLLNLP